MSALGIPRRAVEWMTVRTALLVGLLLVGCAPVSDPSAGLTREEAVALIEQVAPSDLALDTVAEAFALGSRSTDVQRDDLTQALVGHSIEWSFPVFEVQYAEGRYTVTSQPIPIADPNATALTRVMAFVVPQSEADDALLRAVKTGDVIRIRGIVQEIRLRTFVMVVPGVVVGTAQNADASMPAKSTVRTLSGTAE